MPTAVDMQALFNADGVVKLRRRGAPTALWSCGDAEEHARRGALARRLDAGLQEPRGARSLGGTSMAAAWTSCGAWPAAAGLARTAGATIFLFF